MSLENENPTLTEEVPVDTEMKEWLVNYVGEHSQPETGAVTVEMIVDTMAAEFPEFLMAVAEENYIRGYKQALDDAEVGEQILKEQQSFWRHFCVH